MIKRKIFFKKGCHFRFLFVPYMRGKSKIKGLGILPNIKINFKRVWLHSLCLLVCKNQQAYKMIFVNEYSFTVLAMI